MASRFGRSFRCSASSAIVFWAFGSGVASAGATTTALVGLPNVAQKLSAYDGYVVFSEYQRAANNWRLMAWHAGKTRALPVPPRDMPFDANVGSDRNGHPTVVYSRCAKDPPAAGSQRQPDWELATGCQIFELNLLHGKPGPVHPIYSVKRRTRLQRSGGAKSLSRASTAVRMPRVSICGGPHSDDSFGWMLVRHPARRHPNCPHLWGAERGKSRTVRKRTVMHPRHGSTKCLSGNPRLPMFG
jgi:hypothetical protein